MSLKKNIMYNSLYQILNVILPLITTPYISRTLGVSNIGVFSYTYSIVSYFMMFILLGVNNYGNRMIAKIRMNKTDLSQKFWSLYFLQLISGVIVVTIYFVYVLFFSKHKEVAIIQSIFLFSAMLDINWFFFGLEKFKLTVTRNAIIKVSVFLLIIFFVKSKDDLILYTLFMALSSLVSQIIIWYFLKKNVNFYFPKLHMILEHLVPNLTLFIPVIAVSLYTTLSKIILGFFSTTTEVGYLESVNKLVVVPTLAVSALCTVMMPRISNLIAEGNEKQAKSYINNSLKLSVIFSVPMVFGMSAVSKEFVPIFFGSGFEKCVVLLPIIITSSIFISWDNIIRSQCLIPYGLDRIYVKSVIIGALINVLLNILLVIRLQSIGAAIATLITELGICIYQTIKVADRVPVVKLIKEIVPFIIIGVVMYFCVAFIPLIVSNFITMIIKIMVGIIIYGMGTLFLLKNYTIIK